MIIRASDRSDSLLPSSDEIARDESLLDCSKFLYCAQVTGSIVLLGTFIFFFVLLWNADCLLSDELSDAAEQSYECLW